MSDVSKGWRGVDTLSLVSKEAEWPIKVKESSQSFSKVYCFVILYSCFPVSVLYYHIEAHI